MSNLPQEDRETRKVVDEFTRLLRQKSKEEREAMLAQARDEALADELAEARQQSEREAAALREKLAYDPAKERDRARETAKSAALLLIMLLLILLLIAAATGRTDILPIPGAQPPQTLRPVLGTATGEFHPDAIRPTFPPGVTPEVDPTFSAYYNDLERFGKQCSIGRPISMGYNSEGVRYQWFERAVLKKMPAGVVDDPSWEIQGELLGREVTTGIDFPTTPPLLSQPGNYNFGETGYTVSGEFLNFWTNCDGLHVLGYPISDPVYEVLTPNKDQKLYLVQYFERGRLEYHQEDPIQPVQFGLLGLIKSQDRNFRANVVMPPKPGAAVVPVVNPPAPPAPASTPLPAATAVPIPAASPTLPAATGYPAP